MKIVDNRASDIIAGYQHIRTAENTLQSKWRAPLLDVYAKQREIYKLETQKYQKQKLDFRRRLRLGIWLATSLLILGLLVLPGLLLINQLGEVPVLLVCFSPLLILGGLTGWAIIVVLWIWQRDQEKPVPPQNPLKTGVFYPLYPLWKEGLRGVLPGKKPDPSATGVARSPILLQQEFFVLSPDCRNLISIPTSFTEYNNNRGKKWISSLLVRKEFGYLK
jgi:hypothetical protein